MKLDKIIFYVSTGVLTAIMLFSSGMYFFKHDMIEGAFKSFGYPTYIIYPYAIVKLVGLIPIWGAKFKILKEWAYAGYLYAFTLAFFAHVMIGDGQQGTVIVAFAALVISYIFNKRLYK
ncbi:DoxX family protein [Seonamhaeicola marinus]|uniref:DoxX family protein n=1 Tax=Seonamhaeicola marinus TaxID=1912246 RepID=A0A5D0HKL2_9FLAO|nr:DoxX family protein [Seonamhaeicola marinus]TYA71795.1 DoxX family protein [Seonamhaeicola marinus]